ncbi:hypothetical protein SUGI_1084110 [Cryptomeria japonica]|nr:hypothetical protein SUGI_1084110 [Cryptomeria japonica]
MDVDLCILEQLDTTMQMLFLTCRGNAEGLKALLDHHHPPSMSIALILDDRTALHVAACQGHAHLVHLLISRGANVNARDRWGSTPLVDAKYYGNTEICNTLKSNGAKPPKTTMSLANTQHVPEYELNRVELSFPCNANTSKVW